MPKSELSKVEWLYQKLRDGIISCEIKPGSRLVERVLCEEYDVSRVCVRQALSQLGNEKLVEVKKNSGVRVIEFTAKLFRDVCEMRKIIESQIAGIAAERASKASINKMRKLATFKLKANEKDPHIVYAKSNHAFHMAVVESIGNDYLYDTMEQVLDRDNQPLYYGLDLARCTNADEISAEHHEIVDAIEAGDAKKATKLTWEHIYSKEKRVLWTFEKNPYLK